MFEFQTLKYSTVVNVLRGNLNNLNLNDCGETLLGCLYSVIIMGLFLLNSEFIK